MLKSLAACERKVRYTTGDGLIGAGVMIGASLLFTMLGMTAQRAGLRVTGDVLVNVAFPGALMLSMPFWLMRGQPWKAQAVIVGVTLIVLVGIGYFRSLA